MLSTVRSAGLLGIDAYALEVEVDICKTSFPKWQTVGLADSEVKESKERVVAAIKNSGYDFVQRRITINLAPADVKKEGTALDLPIALGLMASSGFIEKSHLQKFLCLGELSLNGELRPIRGALPMAILAAKNGYHGILLPKQNAHEASMVEGLDVFALENLAQAVDFLTGQLNLETFSIPPFSSKNQNNYKVDFDEVCGQFQAKRALEVAASGGHHLLFVGSPGCGKTLMASRLPTILPSLSFKEALETSRIYSVVNLLVQEEGLLTARPFRSPHHSISDAGLIGGGSHPKPGEVSLAHNGVLFLDELPEFKRNVLELLRQPLESSEVTISRAAMSLTYPARFMMVAAMNPCKCGNYGHPKIQCTCLPAQVHRYRSRISGPLIDRIDLQIEVPPISFEEMNRKDDKRETSEQIRNRVVAIRRIQKERFSKENFLLNSQMGPKAIRKYCVLDDSGKQLLKGIMEKFHLSARAYDRILRVARTLADMNGAENIKTENLLEAVQYRSLDRSLF